MSHQHQPRGIAAPLRGIVAGKTHRSRGVFDKRREPRRREDRIIRHNRNNTLRRQRGTDKTVEIARTALPATAIEKHKDGRLSRMARLIDIKPLSRPLAICETAVFLPRAVRLPQIKQFGRRKVALRPDAIALAQRLGVCGSGSRHRMPPITWPEHSAIDPAKEKAALDVT